jgi:hypothetical protein
MFMFVFTSLLLEVSRYCILILGWSGLTPLRSLSPSIRTDVIVTTISKMNKHYLFYLFICSSHQAFHQSSTINTWLRNDGDDDRSRCLLFFVNRTDLLSVDFIDLDGLSRSLRVWTSLFIMCRFVGSAGNRPATGTVYRLHHIPSYHIRLHDGRILNFALINAYYCISYALVERLLFQCNHNNISYSFPHALYLASSNN